MIWIYTVCKGKVYSGSAGQRLKVHQITHIKWFPTLKYKDLKIIYYSAGNQCYQRKIVRQVNLAMPPVVNRLISVRRVMDSSNKMSG